MRVMAASDDLATLISTGTGLALVRLKETCWETSSPLLAKRRGAVESREGATHRLVCCERLSCLSGPSSVASFRGQDFPKLAKHAGAAVSSR